MDSVLEGLGTVKDQLRKMEEREAEKGLQQSLKRAVSFLGLMRNWKISVTASGIHNRCGIRALER